MLVIPLACKVAAVVTMMAKRLPIGIALRER
jgi:hypothetical protein